MVVDFDDFGVNHVLSPACQSHDCRDKLDQLHYANNDFKVTLFTIPWEMSLELLEWCKANSGWVELAVHGFRHGSNYECEKMSYDEFNQNMERIAAVVDEYFVKGFKAPGWQISDDALQWLADNGWWVSDQSYNNDRRPGSLPVYLNNNGQFMAIPRVGNPVEVESWHGHTWDCVGNGIYETYEHVESLVRAADNFQFVSEVLA